MGFFWQILTHRVGEVSQPRSIRWQSQTWMRWATLWPEMNGVAGFLLPAIGGTRAITSALDAATRFHASRHVRCDIASLAGVGVQQEGESANVFADLVRR